MFVGAGENNIKKKKELDVVSKKKDVVVLFRGKSDVDCLERKSGFSTESIVVKCGIKCGNDQIIKCKESTESEEDDRDKSKFQHSEQEHD